MKVNCRQNVVRKKPIMIVFSMIVRFVLCTLLSKQLDAHKTKANVEACKHLSFIQPDVSCPKKRKETYIKI